ncbi:anthranilate phosphoribosyltransferase [Chitinophaga pinensis]|uniref:Anthranilate phosphoribosyltransferase n=1 Tax=Chitinophaga pinensis TaxID=79329 RepID=A0A5C6LWE2_9BACT|nr:anthranilate phosphoribosyltransferase [Chitinophaga pinensis]TWW00870.1 anthranilate phosphoribosyltransferase [Chitinophaga pinensis]
MKKILNYLFEHKTFTREAAKEILISISKGMYNESELAAFMTVFLMRSITVEELLGFRDALLELCIPVNLNGYEVLDIVGTGGDGKNTFNVSTLSCFIVAGAGGKVAKHGNYGVSSISGASNLMETAGYKFKNDDAKLREELEEAGVCFLHAPLFHPALKNVAGIRRQLGIRTFFNMLGPLVNPAFAQHQLIGVYSLELARVYNYLFQQTDKRYAIVYSLDGYDEISLTADTRVITNEGERDWTPEQLGKRKVYPEDIYGGNTVEAASKIFMKILKGEGTWAQNSVVMANAAMGLYCMKKYDNYADCFLAAVESLESGAAHNAFKKLISLQS